MTHAQFCAAPNLLNRLADVERYETTFPLAGVDLWQELALRVDDTLRRIIDRTARFAFDYFAETCFVKVTVAKQSLLVHEAVRHWTEPRRRRLPMPYMMRYDDGALGVQVYPGVDPFPHFSGTTRIRFEAWCDPC